MFYRASRRTGLSVACMEALTDAHRRVSARDLGFQAAEAFRDHYDCMGREVQAASEGDELGAARARKQSKAHFQTFLDAHARHQAALAARGTTYWQAYNRPADSHT